MSEQPDRTTFGNAWQSVSVALHHALRGEPFVRDDVDRERLRADLAIVSRGVGGVFGLLPETREKQAPLFGAEGT